MRKSARILLVEDESLVRLMVNEMLVDLGHEVVAEADSLDRAIELATTEDYDLAILDVNLGDVDTYAVAEIARDRGKAVVFSTGYGPAEMPADYRSSVVLQKPFTNDALSRAVGLALSQAARGKSC